ncbi:hypothetical protein Pla110_01370 [Polystyrenella longa]|uniref:ASCH domain-containing protein n=1 Tax=Polystyrenella longa TaxID=2528007 RepID=A0A518CGT2_9PLAN|nr:hypothetical protein Pla110_01370 [Polystyrenella longa]
MSLPASNKPLSSLLPADVDLERPALGIQYPWIELILRGIKTIEVRSWEQNIEANSISMLRRRMLRQITRSSGRENMN